jgi:protein AATF/BFR2
VRHQRALWERSLELRILLQRPLAGSNRLPQPAVRASALAQDEGLAAGYRQLLAASADTLQQLLELQAALLGSNPGIIGAPPEELQQGAGAKVRDEALLCCP